MIKGSLCITGGNGFLGRGILRQAQRDSWPCTITTMSRDEAKQIRVLSRYPNTHIIRGDVAGDLDTLTRIFTGFDIVIHAAANKLVDIGEMHAWEVTRNNVIGSMNVAQAAYRAGVKQCLLISSDKAVQAVNAYGMTKVIGERLWQEADGWGDTEFLVCRYGNVIGSTISIATYFREQLARDGYIHVTNPAMSRYYFGVDEAIDLVTWTLNHAQRGSVAIPRAMKAMTVAGFAEVALGRPWSEGDPRVKVVGERPGEKLHEALLHSQESVRVLMPTDDCSPWQLRPPGEVHRTRSDAFELTSADPVGGWISGAELERLVVDALNV